MIVSNLLSAKKSRQVVNALIRLKANTSNISEVLDDLNSAYDIEELNILKELLDTHIKKINDEKNKNNSSTIVS